MAWLKGTLVFMGVTAAAAMGIAWLLDREILAEHNWSYAVMAMLIGSAYAGGMVSGNQAQSRRLQICLVSGLLDYGILLGINALFFDGRYSGAGETALLIFCGVILAALFGAREKGRGKGPKTKKRNR